MSRLIFWMRKMMIELFQMVEMARTHDLNIYKYLNYLLEQLPAANMTDDGFAKLVPWDGEVIAQCSEAL